MSFIEMKHVYTVSNAYEFWKQGYETPLRLALLSMMLKSFNTLNKECPNDLV